jgi:hypothetical protein
MTPAITPEMRDALSLAAGGPILVQDAATQKAYYLSTEPSSFDGFTEVIRITKEMFGQFGGVEVDTTHDPEYPDEKYVVFTAMVEGDNRTLLRFEDEWIRRVADVIPRWNAFRLRLRRKQRRMVGTGD